MKHDTGSQVFDYKMENRGKTCFATNQEDAMMGVRVASL